MGSLSDKALTFNKDEEVNKISDRLVEILRKDVHRRGLVVPMSGGIDSSVSAALCVKALGPKKFLVYYYQKLILPLKVSEKVNYWLNI